MRYSISGNPLDTGYVMSLGGTNVRAFPSTGIVFADLDLPQVSALQNSGYIVLPVERVQRAPGGDNTGLRISGSQKTLDFSRQALAGTCNEEDDKPYGIIAPIQPPNQGIKMYKPQQLIGLASIGLLGKYKGLGVNIAIIDTGIRETHNALKDHIVFSKNYTHDDMIDGYNHGTNVADIILSVVPMAGILNMKVMDSQGDGSTEEIIEAIDDCIAMQDTRPDIAPAIINISAGTADTGNINDPLRIACRAAVANGIWVSAAAGNLGPDPETIVSPACERYVFATGSVKENPMYLMSEFSSRGPTKEGLTKPDAVFFGENIIVASSEADDAYLCKSGTSFSAPFSTGIAALYMEALARIPAEKTTGSDKLDGEVVSQITAEQLLDGGLGPLCIKPQDIRAQSNLAKDNNYGYGVPDGRLIAQSLDGVYSGPYSQAYDAMDQALVATIDPTDAMVAMMFVAMIKIMSSVAFSKNKKDQSDKKVVIKQAKQLAQFL